MSYKSQENTMKILESVDARATMAERLDWMHRIDNDYFFKK